MHKASLVAFLTLIATLSAAKWSVAQRHHSRKAAQRSVAVQWRTSSSDSRAVSYQQQARKEQRDFCMSASLPLIDAADNSVRYPVTFEGLAFSIYCYVQHDVVSNGILQAGSWEASFSKHMLHAMHQGCLKQNISKSQAAFLDIGANIGWFSLLFAAAGHQVIAFEPMHANQQLLRRSLCSNAGFQEKVTLYTNMLGNASHTNCTIFSANENLGDGIVTCQQHFVIPDNYTVKESSLHISTIDKILEGDNHHIVMVKMDVEGYEGHVFQGAELSILQAHVPYILFEFHYAWIDRSEGRPDMLLARLVQEGYQCSFESFHGTVFDLVKFYSVPAVQQEDVIRNIFCSHASVL